MNKKDNDNFTGTDYNSIGENNNLEDNSSISVQGPKGDSKSKDYVKGSYLAMWMCLGVTFGVIFNNIALGLCIGVAIGASMDANASNKSGKAK